MDTGFMFGTTKMRELLIRVFFFFLSEVGGDVRNRGLGLWRIEHSKKA